MDAIGKLNPPGTAVKTQAAELGPFLSNIIRIIIVLAGAYALIQLILGGLGYISSQGDSKKTQEAMQKITYSIIGLAVIAVSFVIVSILGRLFFGSAFDITNPVIQTL